MTNPDPITVLQLSDLHLTENQVELYPGVNPYQRFVKAAELAKDISPNLVIISGDICQRGNDAYAAAAELINQLRADISAPVLVISGNHDRPEQLDHRFHDPHSRPEDPAVIDLAVPAAGEDGLLRFIGLNTTGQDTKYGVLPEAELLRCRNLLAELDPQRGQKAVVVMHHPPVDAMPPSIASIGLKNRKVLKPVIKSGPVSLILSGHFHFPQTASFAGVPVWVSPALAYTNDPLSPSGTLRGLSDSGISLIRFSPKKMRPLISPIWLDQHPTDLGSARVLFSKTKKKK